MIAASPTTSGKLDRSLVITGVPQAIASRGGSPNPSMKLGQTNPPTKAQLWWKNPLRRKYSGVIFEPGKPEEVDGKFNLWRGFAITPKAGTSKLYWKLVHEVICGGDDEVYAYVRKYFAHLVQRPQELPGISIALRSGQGTGKNTFMKPFREILGRAHYIEITSTQQLIGNFNVHLGNKLLVFANEAMWGGDKKAEGRLKAMVTDTEEGIERKFFDLTTETNYKRIVFASNADWIVPVDLDDRRFLILEVNDCYREDVEFWTRLHQEFESGGYEAILYDLLNEPLEGFVVTDRPTTEATERAALEQKMQRWDSATEFWHTTLQKGRIRNLSLGFVAGQDHTGLWPRHCERGALYNIYQGWCKDNGEKHPANRETFGRKLRELCPKIADTRPTNDAGKRPRQHLIPPLAECRKLFDKAIRAHIEWEHEDDSSFRDI